MASTDPARWERLKALLPDAAALGAADRAAFLDRLGEAGLRADLEALLAAHDEAEAADRFGKPAFGAEARPAAPATHIGPYRLAEEVGRGGMGTVYRAERADGQFEQTVALKLLPAGLASAGSVERFRAERGILARLEHPRIARLIDGGVTGAGLLGREMPWLAMEFVDGPALTDFAERERLSVGARVRLFLQVCDAVAYAHQSLVVHRDLKPSNILVTPGGGPDGGPSVKLLDFGIAKLIEEDGGEALTQTGMRVMTPEYAAPEQVRGEAVTTATDAYALGVLLFELLAGARPYDLSGLSPSDIERTVCRTVPTRPSASVRPAQYDADVAPRLRGDLDTIVLKALAKEPGQRYAGADALADDLRRHLDGRPVAARPATAGYRARTFVRRHRAATAAAALVALALVAGAGLALWQARIAAAERDRTAAALAQAEGTLDFLEETILLGSPQEGDPDAPLSAVLDSAAARVDDEASSPQVAGAIHTSLTGVYNGRGLPDRAEHHARRALAMLPDDDVRRGWALDGLAVALNDSGRPAEAEPVHLRAIATLREYGDDRQLAVALNNYGGTLGSLGRIDEAEAAYQESLGIRQRLGMETLGMLNNLAVLFLERGDSERAAEAFADLVTALRQTTDPGAAYQLPFALVNWANALSDLGQAEEPTAAFREAHALSADLIGEDHPETIAVRVSLVSHFNRSGQLDRAVEEGEATLAVAEGALEAGHPFLAYAQNVVGAAFCNADDLQRGTVLLRTSLGSRRAMLPPEHWLLGSGESLLGGCLGKLGRDAEALPLLRDGYDRMRAALGDDHPRTEEARSRLADFLEARGRSAEAEALGEHRDKPSAP